MELKKQIEDLQNIPLNNAKSNEFIEKMNSIYLKNNKNRNIYICLIAIKIQSFV